MARLELKRGERGEFTTNQRADGKWKARCYYRDEQGIRREVTATSTSKARALTLAKKKWSNLVDDLSQQNPRRTSEPITLVQMLDQWHVEQQQNVGKPGKRSAATIFRYRQQIDTVIVPSAGGWLIHETTPGRLNRLFDSMVDEEGNGLSKARTARSMLSVAFQWAVGHDMLATNPVRDTHTIAKIRKTPDSLTADEIRTIRDAVHTWAHPTTGDSRLGPRSPIVSDVLEVLLGTGARIGEVLALRWENVHLNPTDGNPPWVMIEETLSTVDASGAQKVVPTKGGDQRMIAIPDFVAEILRTRRISDGGSALVFTSRTGTHMPPNNVRRAIRRALQYAGVDEDLCRRATPHAMRRTVATMVQREIGMAEASKQLGHSDERITKEHYVTPTREFINYTSVLNRLGPNAAQSEAIG